MKRYFLSIGIAALTVAAATAGPRTENTAGPAAFARLKTLVGEWEANTSMGKSHVSYELIAGGTSLVEHESGEKMPAMVTVYYLDGDRLMLTHYCMAGNQPRMQASSFNPETGEIVFQFLDATNLTPGGGHMHNATFRLPGGDRFSADWQFYENNQPKMSHTAEYSRVK